MRINYNVSAMLANNTLSNNDNRLSNSIQRLSSGLKINNAKDNPAGLAMAKRMNAQIRGTEMANQNANDGISVIETADGALSEIQAMIQRMTELSTKAATGTLTDDDREIIQKEVEQLQKEIERISESTQFNGQNLLDGTYGIKAYTTENDLKVSAVAKEVTPGEYVLDALNWSVKNEDTGEMEATFTPGEGFPSTEPGDYTVSMTDNYVTIDGPSGFSMTYEINEKLVFDDEGKPMGGSIGSTTIDCTDVGPMRLQVGSNEGQVIAVDIPAVSLGNMGIAKIDVSTQDKAGYAIDRLDLATQYINSVRGKLGAYQNRLESTTENLGVVDENMTSAYSRIMDVDMADEMTQYSTYNVLVQAGTSVLAQANDRPSTVLQLLQ
ncbi:MAG: flagellin FliC3 [Lachnospiraceae bacterium]|nr:flagellin FliC3 [Lachnospiraceae bacterium]